MSQDEQGTEELRLSELQRRVDDVEDRQEQQQQLLARHEALLRRLKEFRSRERSSGRQTGETPCTKCDEGVLVKKGEKLVCTSCDYMSYL